MPDVIDPWPSGHQWLAILNVAGVAATVVAAWAAVVALRAIDSDRRATFEIQELRAIRVALTDYSVLGSSVSDPIKVSLILLPQDLLPLTRQVFGRPHGSAMWASVGGVEPDEKRHGSEFQEFAQQGGLMPDGKTTVGSAVKAEVDAALGERVLPTRPSWWRW